MSNKRKKPSVFLVSLGCAKNLVDSEVILGAFVKKHWSVQDDPLSADVLMVNTCGFIQPAVEEAIDEILHLAEIKKRNPEKRLIVVGCLVQRYKEQLLESLPEVDQFIGTEAAPFFSRYIDRILEEPVSAKIEIPERTLMDSTVPRTMITPGYRSWLKITEGCDNCCSYCLIPSIRGGLRSRSIEDLVCEARLLEERGVKELSLIAQDLTAFGKERGGKEDLHGLLKRLLQETAIPWLRLLYLYPTGIDERILHLMAENPRLLPYLDMPIQHASSKVLAAMNRRYTLDDLTRRIDTIRRIVPDIALRTTLLVGFPGETLDDIKQLEDFLRQSRFDHVGIFSYSNEEGSPSEKFAGHCSDEENAARRDRLLQVQADISTEALKKYVGRVEAVLVEGKSSESDLLLEGRTRFQAPEVDGCVYIVNGVLNPGDIVDVHITEAHVYDLVGEVVEGGGFSLEIGT